MNHQDYRILFGEVPCFHIEREKWDKYVDLIWDTRMFLDAIDKLCKIKF
jgi:hypothetical protein